MSNKPRIATRLKDAIGAGSSHHSSPDLKLLSDRFNVLKGRLHTLVAALADHYDSMIRLNKTRSNVSNAIRDISENSPIYVYAGAPDEKKPSEEVEEEENGGGEIVDGDAATSSETTTMSYAAVHSVLALRNKMYTERYMQFVVEYAVEWEKVVVTKITASLKKAEKLRVDLDHYDSKVEGIRQSIRNAVDRGKSVDPNQSEKLRRNEEKLTNARNQYESFVSELCVLLEEVTDSCWKDLQPLLVKIVQFELTLNSDEAKFLQNINHALDALEDVARKHGMDVNAPEGPGISKCRHFDEPEGGKPSSTMTSNNGKGNDEGHTNVHDGEIEVESMDETES